MGLQRTRAQAAHARGRERVPGGMRLLRTVPLAFALGLVLSTPSQGPAEWGIETDQGKMVMTGDVEVGGRAIKGDFQSTKYQEYREQSPGIFGNARLLLEGKEGRYYFEGLATDIAERDQHYEIAIGRYGRYRLELEYDEHLHVYSTAARSLYTNQGGGVLTFPDATQGAIQAVPSGPAQAATRSGILQSALGGATGVPLRFRLQTGRVGLFYRPLADLEFDAGYWIQEKQGTRPFGMGFASPGGNFANVAAPIDERTHEVTGGIQVARDTWSLRLDYTGSFYENDLDTVTIDNPLQLTDGAFSGTSSTPGRGRTDLAPDNSSHTIRLSGAATLPVGFPARFAGTFSYGMRFQNEPFVPHTINASIPTGSAGASLALPAGSLDGEVRTLLANLVLTGRPQRDLNLTARYRFYDYNSDIPILVFDGHVVNDQSLSDEDRENTPVDHRIHNASLDASYRLARPATLKVGYEWERWDRTDHREVTRTDEHTAKAAVDYKPAGWALLRAGYRFAIKRGTDYNTFAHLEHTIVDEADASTAVLTGQSTLLRKFDEADRNRHQVDLMAQFSPREDVTLTLTGGYGLTDYNNPALGLVEDERWSVGTEVGYRPLDWVGLSAWYTFESIQFRQDSRWRPVVSGAPVDNPVNNWSSISRDLVHTAGVGAEMVLIPDRLDASLSYVLEIAEAKTLAQAIPGTTSATDGGNAVGWPDIKDTLQTFIAALRYHILKNLTVKAEYRLEHFNLANFKTDGIEPFMANSNVNAVGAVSPSLDVFLGDRVDDYVVHVIALSLIYRF